MQFKIFLKNHRLWVLMFALGISGPIVSGVSPSEIPSSRDGLKLTSSEVKIIPNMTDHLTVSCEFTKQNNSEVKFVSSMILSYWENAKRTFQKLLSISSFNPKASVNHDVGATTSGTLLQNGTSFLTLEWNYPNKNVATRYLCSVHTMDATGSPYNWKVSLEIQLETNDLSSLADEVLELKKDVSKLKKVEQKQFAITYELADLLKSVFNKVLDLHGVNNWKPKTHDFSFKIDNKTIYWIEDRRIFKTARAACIITGGKLAEFKFEQLKAVGSQIEAATATTTEDLWVGYYREDTSNSNYWKYASTGNDAGTLPLWEDLDDDEKCIAFYNGENGYDPDPCTDIKSALCVRS